MIVACVLLLYIFYLFSLPNVVEADYWGYLIYGLVINSYMLVVVMLCLQMCCLLKLNYRQNREVGKMCLIEAGVFFSAQVIFIAFCTWLVNGSESDIKFLTHYTLLNSTFWDWSVSLLLVPFFALTEFVPSIAFAHYIDVYSRHFVGEHEARLLE